MARRLLIFSVGFFMGCVLVYTTMFKGTDREFYGSWLPEGRVIKKLNSSLNRDHSSYQCILDKSGVFESEVDEMFLYHLDIEGISVSGGSACSSGSNIGSHVLRGINSPMDRPSVRFSFGRFNTIADVDRTVEVISKIYTS